MSKDEDKGNLDENTETLEETIEEELDENTETLEETIEEELDEESDVISEEAQVEGVNRGDFILVEMTGRSEETEEIFDTTDEEIARDANIYSDDRVYGPKMVVVGEGWLLKGLDERLEGLQLEETAEVEIPPEEAFGVRDPENVRTIPFRVLRSKGINPNLGAQVEVDGRSAIVRSIGAGRVQLDYNHPLAGRSIIYEVKVTKLYETDEDKIRALISRRFLAVDSNIFGIKLLKKKIRITVPEEIFFAENIQMAKRGVALDIQMFFPNIQDVEYVEVIERRT